MTQFLRFPPSFATRAAARVPAVVVALVLGLCLRVDAADLTFSAAADYAQWQSAEVVEPVTNAPEWVRTAAGSSPFEEHAEAISVAGRQPGPHGELVGYSALEADVETANEGASRSAVAQLQALLLWELRDDVRWGPLVPYAALAAAEVRRQFAELVRDRYNGSIERSYGSLHRAAVLVAADESTMAALLQGLHERIERANVEAAERHQRFWWKFGISGVLTTLALLAYAAFNTATQGYLTWRLRFLLLVVVAAIYGSTFGLVA